MNYRPITDFWILGRPKIGYFGSYPAGFLERARPLLVGGDPQAVVAHIPGGMARRYNGGPFNLSGFGVNDWTVDLDPKCKPDVVFDLREFANVVCNARSIIFPGKRLPRPRSILIDLPYGVDEADHYAPGRDKLPKVNEVLRAALSRVQPGGIVGVLDYVWPSPAPLKAKEVFSIAISCGRNNRIRNFTGWRLIK